MKNLLIITILFNQALAEEASLTPILPNATPIILPQRPQIKESQTSEDAKEKILLSPIEDIKNSSQQREASQISIKPIEDKEKPPLLSPVLDKNLPISEEANKSIIQGKEDKTSVQEAQEELPINQVPVELNLQDKREEANPEKNLPISQMPQLIVEENKNLVENPLIKDEKVPAKNLQTELIGEKLQEEAFLQLVPPQVNETIKASEASQTPIKPIADKEKQPLLNPVLDKNLPINPFEAKETNQNQLIPPTSPELELIPLPKEEKEEIINLIPKNEFKTKEEKLTIQGENKQKNVTAINSKNSEKSVKKLDKKPIVSKKVIPPLEEEITLEEIILETEILSNPVKNHHIINQKLPQTFYQSEYTSLLFSAVKNDDLAGIKSLLKKGANINAQEIATGYTLPIYAVKFNRIKALRSLIIQGVDLTKVTLEGQTALHFATKMGNLEAIEVLLAAGLDPTIKDKNGLRAADYMKKSMKSAAPIMAANYQDMNKALIDFTGLGSLEAVEYALQKGAKIDFKDDVTIEGDTALMIAIKSQDLPMVSFLLNQGASLSIKNKRGKSPRDLALMTGNSQLIAILKTVQINRELVSITN
jgi:ankyrin repeat protein